MKIMTNSIVFVLFTCLYLSMGFSFDLSQTDKHGQVLSQESCNKDTVIDLRLSPDTVLSSCSLSGCTLVKNLLLSSRMHNRVLYVS